MTEQDARDLANAINLVTARRDVAEAFHSGGNHWLVRFGPENGPYVMVGESGWGLYLKPQDFYEGVGAKQHDWKGD
jgi:hypothetical protein